jgi:hypothetical protein
VVAGVSVGVGAVVHGLLVGWRLWRVSSKKMLLGELLLRLRMNLDSGLFGVAIHVPSNKSAQDAH